MLTSKTPPESSYVLNDGLPQDVLTKAGVNDNIIAVVEKAMAPIKKDRYQTVTELSKAISALSSSVEEEEGTTIDIDTREKSKLKVDPNTDEIGFHFVGSSYPSSRSYETHITENTISLKISCYGDILHEEDYPFNKLRFSKLIETIKELDIHKIPEFDDGATGGETLSLALHRNGTEYFSGYIYGDEHQRFGGTTDANLYRVKTEIEKCIPNFQFLLAKEKDEESEEYVFEDEEPFFFEKYWKYGLAAVVVLLCIYFCSNWNSSSLNSENDVLDTLFVDSVAVDTVVPEVTKITPQAIKKNERTENKIVKEEVKSKQEEQIQSTSQSPTRPDNGGVQQNQNNVGSYNVEARPEPVKTGTVFDVVEEMPSFPGGDSGLMAYLSQTIKYPVAAEENGIQGRVIVTFVVERDGSITDVKVAKSVDPSLDKEAVRVIKSMPLWKPGKQDGSAVRVKYTVPITFRLQ